MYTKKTVYLIIWVILIFTSIQNTKACSPLNVPTLVSQSIVGSNLVLNWKGNTIYLCADVIDVEIACNTAAFSGLAAYTYTSSVVTGASTPYNYPAMNIPIGSLCPGTVYKFRARERNNGGATASAWSANFTFTTSGVFTAPTLTIGATLNSICINGSSQLTASVTGCGTGTNTYAWTPTTGLSCSTCSNPIASPTITTSYNLTVTGSQTSCWTASSSKNIVVNPCYLPIHLTTLNATCEEDKIKIYWETSSEKENKYYSVLKSSDGINYEVIGTLQGGGNSNSPKSYLHYDKQVEHAHTYYYKLRHTDTDGNETTLEPIIHATCKKQDYQFLLFPNPASNDVQILSENNLYNITLEIVTSLGQRIKQIQNLNLIRNEKLTIDLSDIPNGYYQIILADSSPISRLKMAIQR